VSLSSADLSAMFGDVPSVQADINVWEMYAVVVACRLFGDAMAGQHWRVRTDNAACEAWLMRGVRSSPVVAAWLGLPDGPAVRLLEQQALEFEGADVAASTKVEYLAHWKYWLRFLSPFWAVAVLL
jgi:hypothetical protein